MQRFPFRCAGISPRLSHAKNTPSSSRIKMYLSNARSKTILQSYERYFENRAISNMHLVLRPRLPLLKYKEEICLRIYKPCFLFTTLNINLEIINLKRSSYNNGALLLNGLPEEIRNISLFPRF